MSPAPQGTLEVERYIGSYLISQRPHPNAKTSSPGNKRFQNQQNVKPKPSEPEKVRNFNKYCFPQQRDHHVGGTPRYSVPPPMPMEYGTNPNHYGKHGGGAGWAGMPLISMTSGNHRRNKKTPTATNNNQMQKYSHKQNNQNGFARAKETEEKSQNDSDRSPLTRLAIHTQGAPLIQAGRYSNSNRCRNNVNRGESTTRVYRGESVRWDAAKDQKTAANIQNKDQQCGNTDSLSVASDESSGNSENSLPRIIKPRKRRKKDRKPITGTTSGTSSNEPQTFPREPDQNIESSSTLKAFLPLRYDQHAANPRENSVSDLLLDHSQILSGEETQSEDLIDPLTSADEFPFGNLLDDEEDNHSEVSSCAPATLCQCRYCDPSGIIWDVDQRCYSPFLTPPSPTDSKLSFNSPFNPISRSYNRQVAVVEPPPSSQSHYSINSDLASLLRRSWSEPSYKVPEYFQADHSDKADLLPPSPLGLQVSSEIVTSPNGHRDIEIKFYSSSVPLESSRSKVALSAHDQSDRRFVAEE